MKPAPQRSLLVSTVVVALLAYRRLVFWDPASGFLPRLEAWLLLPTETIPQLNFVLAAALLYRARKRLREAAQGRPAPLLATLPLLVGFSLFLWGHHAQATDLILASFVLVSLGASLLWADVRLARALALPLLVLAFAIPAPAVLTNPAVFSLQQTTAAQATALLALLGFPVYREGIVIYGESVATYIIDTCSPLRFMEITVLFAVAYVAWFPDGRRRGALLVAFALPIAYLFNLLRVCLLVVHPTSDASATHVMPGVVIFLGEIWFIVLADQIARRLFPPPAHRDHEPAPTIELAGIASSNRVPRMLVLAVLLVTMLGVSVWMPRWDSSATGRLPPIELPEEVDGWRRGQVLPVDWAFLWTVLFSKYAHHAYERHDQVVEVFVGDDDRKHRDRSLLSPKNAVPKGGWEIEERGLVELEPSGFRVERVRARSGERRILNYFWYEGTDGFALETLRALLATDQSLLRRQAPARVIRLTTPVSPLPRGRSEAEDTLRGFFHSFRAAFSKSNSRWPDGS